MRLNEIEECVKTNFFTRLANVYFFSFLNISIFYDITLRQLTNVETEYIVKYKKIVRIVRKPVAKF